MGVVRSIKHNTFPKQSNRIGKRAKIWFHYDTENWILGTIIRDDSENPNLTIFKLDNGKYALATECQYGMKIN